MYFVLILVILSCFVIIYGTCFVPQDYVYIIERFGKYYKSAGGGLHFCVPVIDKIRFKMINKPQVLKFSTPILTNDGTYIRISLSPVLLVLNPKLLAYNVPVYNKNVNQLSDTDNTETQAKIKHVDNEFYRSYIQKAETLRTKQVDLSFVEDLIKNKVAKLEINIIDNTLDFASIYKNLEERIFTALAPEIREFGLELTKVIVNEIELSGDAQNIINRKKQVQVENKLAYERLKSREEQIVLQNKIKNEIAKQDIKIKQSYYKNLKDYMDTTDINRMLLKEREINAVNDLSSSKNAKVVYVNKHTDVERENLQ